jgi:5-methylcytosine-specific restriction protein A
MPDRIPTFRPPWINRKAKRDAMPRNQTAAGYNRRAWKLARQERLVIDNWQCQQCGRVVTGREAHVDHIVPKSAGGSDYMKNLQTLCRSCHSRKTVLVDQGGGFGPAVAAARARQTLPPTPESRTSKPACAAGTLPKR